MFLFYFFFQKGRLPSAGWQDEGGGLHSTFLPVIRGLLAVGSELAQSVGKRPLRAPPGANKKTYKAYWCFPV